MSTALSLAATARMNRSSPIASITLPASWRCRRATSVFPSQGCRGSFRTGARDDTGSYWAACARRRTAGVELLDAFLRDSARGGDEVVALQVRARDVALFRGPRLPCRRLRLHLRPRARKLHVCGNEADEAAQPDQARARGRRHRRRAGAGIAPARRASGRGSAGISRAWLKTKGGHELDLLVGEMGRAGNADRRVFVALEWQDQPLGFITYVPVWGERPGVLHNLTRRAPDAPTGCDVGLNQRDGAHARFPGRGRSASCISASRRSWWAWAALRSRRPDHWLVPKCRKRTSSAWEPGGSAVALIQNSITPVGTSGARRVRWSRRRRPFGPYRNVGDETERLVLPIEGHEHTPNRIAGATHLADQQIQLVAAFRLEPGSAESRRAAPGGPAGRRGIPAPARRR